MNTTSNYRKDVLFIADIIIIMAAFYVATMLKKDFMMTSQDLANFKSVIPLITSIYVISFIMMGLYRNMWAYAGLNEYLNVMYANLAAFFALLVLDQILNLSIQVSSIMMGAVLAFIATEGIRIAYRMVMNKTKAGILPQKIDKNRTKTLIIGAGFAGKLLINEVNSNTNMNYEIMGLIDDDKSKLHQSIAGVSVIGTTEDIPRLVNDLELDEVIFAIPSLSQEQSKRIYNIVNKTKVRMKTLPNISEIINKGIDLSQIRDVDITDLLGRKEIDMDLTSMNDYLGGKVVLVTGGGGSIGSELCRQIARYRPRKLIIFDIYENSAYEIQQELQGDFPQLDLVTLIGSVRDRNKVNEVFKFYKPDMVFHAAAHKHVPLMETSPKEAIKNNVFGTLNVVQAADAAGTERFLLISTDKAVNPSNVMGASKRLCEMIIQTYDRISNNTCYVAVRFGNVLGSNGSVIPLFKKQIKDGGPVTVTHREITRYFMTIPEAVSLVLTAGTYAKGGEIFVLDMGEPVKIYDLALNLIRLSGYEPNQDIRIELTGLRPGEKLYEELLMSEEGLTKTQNSLIYIGQPTSFEWEILLESLRKLSELIHDETVADEVIRQAVHQIVPTYNYVQGSSSCAFIVDKGSLDLA